MIETALPDGTIRVDQSEMNVLFVHSKIDDAGLSPYAFRVFCHISRRANRSGAAWPGVASMSKACQMSASMIKKAVKELEARQMLTVNRSEGGRETNTYLINAPSKWIAQEISKSSDATDEPTQSHSNRVTQQPGAGHTVTGTPLPESHKGTPLTNSNESTIQPPGGDLFGSSVVTDKKTKGIPSDDALEKNEQVSKLYEAYPRHKQPVPARRAIWKALKKVPFETLLAAVEEFKRRCISKGTKNDYIPYPASWFNAGSWDDKDTSTTHDENTRLW